LVEPLPAASPAGKKGSPGVRLDYFAFQIIAGIILLIVMQVIATCGGCR
jgi:hypothetical protein